MQEASSSTMRLQAVDLPLDAAQALEIPLPLLTVEHLRRSR
jgi:hypothetical protein